MYTIIDVETTGKTNRITEISIFKYDGKKVIDEFTSLVNPEIEIPDYITALTGIDNFIVAKAPTFKEIAEKVCSITANATFVAHNVNFDYNVIKGELNRLGITFRRKKLCTVRLSRKLIPNLHSYSLGKLCAALQIPLIDRHRARGDAEATVLLFKHLEKQEGASNAFEHFLKANSRQATLPSHLPDEVFNTIPSTAGIYYFRNKKGVIIYVGKAIDLKKRVLSHFYSKKQKELDLCRETAHIDTELSGSELIALLMEDAAIKKHFPFYNVASKRQPRSYGIFTYTDRQGIIHFAVNTLKLCPNPLQIFYSQRDAVLYLEKICAAYDLCPKYCSLQEVNTACNHYKIKTCKGICSKKESIALYNTRVKQAIETIVDSCRDTVIKKLGRSLDEEGFVWVKNGVYQGFGFIPKTATIVQKEELVTFLTPQKDSIDIQRILRKELLKTDHVIS